MKITLRKLTASLIALILVIGNMPKSQNYAENFGVTGIAVSTQSFNCAPNDVVALSAAVLPGNATNQNIYLSLIHI